MGFKDVKRQVISCLKEGAYDHEVRGQIDLKNLFQCGQLSDDDVMEMIKKTRGYEYECRPHHKVPAIDVHIMKSFVHGRTWYIKFYFVEPDAVFISVHESEV